MSKKTNEQKIKETAAVAEQLNIAMEEIAEGIKQLSAGMHAVAKGRLKEKALLVLLSHASGLPQGTVQKVVTAMQQLEKTYLQ